ncbi:MAG: tetratricopeptide repeat protein [Armatimonadetes bacterium]|nr:tetratricopeptide repeat protein [Armatimonadota bacterium]
MRREPARGDPLGAAHRHGPLRDGDGVRARIDPGAASTVNPAALQNYSRGTERLEAGDIEGAISFLELAVQQNVAHASAWCSLGLAYHNAGRLQEAIDAYNRSIEIDPHSVSAYTHLANAYGRLGLFGAAAEQFHNALSLDENFPYAVLGLASAYDRLGDVAQAQHWYRRALQMDLDAAYRQRVEARLLEI